MVNPLRIMISSTREDLMKYRKRASEVIEKLRKEHQGRREIIEVSMEHEPQTGERESAVAISKKWVEGVDWVVLIVGWHYGTIVHEAGATPTGITEREYDHAVTCTKKVFVFLGGETEPDEFFPVSKDEDENLPRFGNKATQEQAEKLKAFRQKLTNKHASFFKNIDHFEEKLEATLQEARRPQI